METRGGSHGNGSLLCPWYCCPQNEQQKWSMSKMVLLDVLGFVKITLGEQTQKSTNSRRQQWKYYGEGGWGGAYEGLLSLHLGLQIEQWNKKERRNNELALGGCRFIFRHNNQLIVKVSNQVRTLPRRPNFGAIALEKNEGWCCWWPPQQAPLFIACCWLNSQSQGAINYPPGF